MEQLKSELEELRATFELRYKADMRAIEQWRQAHPGKELTMPDHADLVCSLLEQNQQAFAEGQKFEQDELCLENSTLKARVIELKQVLQNIIDGCVHPETAKRAIMVDLAPIRKVLNR